MKRLKNILWILLTLGLGAAPVQAALTGVAGPHSSAGTPPAIIPAPTDALDDCVTNSGMQAFNEAQGLVTTVDHDTDSGTIPAGSFIDSHMIFLNSEGSGSLSHFDVTWSFNGTVIGVMSNVEGTFEASSTFELGAAGTNYTTVPIAPATTACGTNTATGERAAPFVARGLEINLGCTAANINDGYTVSGNSITVCMNVTEPGDWIRVITVPGIGTIKPVAFTPTPAGNGRGIAFDGASTLYYTFTGDPNIYMVTTTGALLGPILNPGRTFTCGVLEYHPTTGNILCGTYDGTGTGGGGTADFYSINPTTGVPTLLFNSTAFGGLDGNTCISSFFGFIDGLSFDPTDNTLWLSDDVGRTIYHVDMAGNLIDTFDTPMRPSSTQPGCNSGIEVVPGGFLELVLLAFDEGTDPNHYIVKVSKEDPSGELIVAFPTLDPFCCEDVAFDDSTFAPRAALWTNAIDNEIKAYDVQVTKTIGYWKNHLPEDFDGTSFLPINLGNNDENGICYVVDTEERVEDILNDHRGQNTEPKLKAQLLAAKLNLAMGDVPLADVNAILPVIDAADNLLGRNGCNPDTGKKGADRAEAQALHEQLDAFNNKYSP